MLETVVSFLKRLAKHLGKNTSGLWTAGLSVPKSHNTNKILIKFSYNARSDWLKQRALSENRARVDDIKMAFKLLLRDLDKFSSL